MLCQLLGRAIVLVREDQLSLAIGRRGQNVRLASKLVGWDIEIMTSEELDELIEKAVVGFTRIEGIDTGLAEKLVEQGILSYDDLSVMEIADLVNTIEDLTEEVAVAIVARAEALAEEQADDMPRRKGARPVAPAAPPEPAAEKGATLADLFGDGAAEDSTGATTESPADGDLDDPMEAAEDESLRDLDLAAEAADEPDDGEVTAAPSDADQDETAQIMIDAVESNESATVLDFNEMGEGPNTPEPFLSAGSTGSSAEPAAGEDELNSPDDPDDFLKGSREP